MARRNRLDEVPESLEHRRIGETTGQGIERPKLQPAGPLSGCDVDRVAKRGRRFGLSPPVSQLAVDSPQLGLEVALAPAV